MRQIVKARNAAGRFAGLVLCLCAAPLQALPPLQDVVMYEVNLRAISEDGDLDGVTAQLDEIQSLGANVVWLMPIHPIGGERSVGQLGSPYSVQDYSTVSSEYGGAEWQTNYGTGPSSAVTSLPEPHSFLLATLACGVIGMWRR